MSISKNKYDLDQVERNEIDCEINFLRNVYQDVDFKGTDLDKTEAVARMLNTLTKSQLNLMLMRIGETNFVNKHAVNVGSTKDEIDSVKKWYYLDQMITWVTSPYLKGY